MPTPAKVSVVGCFRYVLEGSLEAIAWYTGLHHAWSKRWFTNPRILSSLVLKAFGAHVLTVMVPSKMLAVSWPVLAFYFREMEVEQSDNLGDRCFVFQDLGMRSRHLRFRVCAPMTCARNGNHAIIQS